MIIVKIVFFLLLFSIFPSLSSSASLPNNFYKYSPVLIDTINSTWPDCAYRVMFPAQIEQETCPSLSSKKCWNPRAELITPRERGTGLGQITIAYDKEGKERFNNFQEARKIDLRLSNWKWEDRYNVRLQLIALVKTDRINYGKVSFAATEEDRLAFTLVAYNSGLGGILQDRRVTIREGGNPDKWWGNVELYSTKSKKPVSGYSISFFTVSRDYPKNILKIRNKKYEKMKWN